MSTLSEWDEKILEQCPKVKPGLSPQEILHKLLGENDSHAGFGRELGELVQRGFLCRDKKLQTLWKEPARVVILQYIEQYKVTSSLDKIVDRYVAMQLGIDESRAHGLVMKALRSLQQDGIVVSHWMGSGEGGTNDCSGTKRYKTYVLKSWWEER